MMDEGDDGDNDDEDYESLDTNGILFES